MNAISTHSTSLLNAKQTVLATALLAAFVASVPYPIEAHATAYGYDYWGTKTVKDIPIPSGQLFGAVEGEGLRVKRAGGEFLSAGNLCNWRIDVDSIDTRTKPHRTSKLVQGRTKSNCTHEDGEKFAINQNVPPGKVCIRLYTAFTQNVANVCHHIHK